MLQTVQTLTQTDSEKHRSRPYTNCPTFNNLVLEGKKWLKWLLQRRQELNNCFCSQSPNVALALSTSWEQTVHFASASGPTSTLPGAMKGAQAWNTELKATVRPAAHSLPLHWMAPCWILTSRTRLEALIDEEGFSNLKESDFKLLPSKRFLNIWISSHFINIHQCITSNKSSPPEIYPVCSCCAVMGGKCYLLTVGCRHWRFWTGPEQSLKLTVWAE